MHLLCEGGCFIIRPDFNVSRQDGRAIGMIPSARLPVVTYTVGSCVLQGMPVITSPSVDVAS